MLKFGYITIQKHLARSMVFQNLKSNKIVRN